ncbi:hypothetical protein BH11BAC2_BH11BAC2_22290 [soil metagenome]
MNRKKKVLILVDWYLPGYKAGGPIQSVANIVGHLKDDFEFKIITSDTDLHATAPYPDIKPDSWNKREDGIAVYYFSAANRSFSKLKEIILNEQSDVIYLNSLFSVFFTIYPLIIRKSFLPNRKLVLSPRGMLGKGALSIKPFKKKIFLSGAKLLGLYKGIRWSVSSELEGNEVRKKFGKNALIQIALNLTAPRELHAAPRRKLSGLLRLVFISRISYKKNLEGTLKLLAQMPVDCKVEFDIYGPIEEPEYWNRCEELIKELPPHIKAEYKGPIANNQVVKTLQSYHLSILLTFNENFGHSIIESMAAGCPVLLSDQTPWKGLEALKAGWDIPLDQEQKILDALITVSKMDQVHFDQWSLSALEYAGRIIHHPDAIHQNRLLFS